MTFFIHLIHTFIGIWGYSMDQMNERGYGGIGRNTGMTNNRDKWKSVHTVSTLHNGIHFTTLQQHTYCV